MSAQTLEQLMFKRSATWKMHGDGNSSDAVLLVLADLEKFLTSAASGTITQDDHDQQDEILIEYDDEKIAVPVDYLGYFLDTIRQAVVISGAAAKKTLSHGSAIKHLNNALSVLIDFYPIATDIKSAQKRGETWGHAYSGENNPGDVYALRDYYHILQILVEIFPRVPELRDIAHSILRNISKMETSKPVLMFQIESSSKYEEGKNAFQDYLSEYINGENKSDPNEVITITTRFLYRAIINRDFSNIKKCTDILNSYFRGSGVTSDTKKYLI